MPETRDRKATGHSPRPRANGIQSARRRGQLQVLFAAAVRAGFCTRAEASRLLGELEIPSFLHRRDRQGR